MVEGLVDSGEGLGERSGDSGEVVELALCKQSPLEPCLKLCCLILLFALSAQALFGLTGVAAPSKLALVKSDSCPCTRLVAICANKRGSCIMPTWVNEGNFPSRVTRVQRHQNRTADNESQENGDFVLVL